MRKPRQLTSFEVFFQDQSARHPPEFGLANPTNRRTRRVTLTEIGTSGMINEDPASIYRVTRGLWRKRQGLQDQEDSSRGTVVVANNLQPHISAALIKHGNHAFRWKLDLSMQYYIHSTTQLPPITIAKETQRLDGKGPHQH